MRLSRKWAKIGRILFYTGTAGWIITAVLQLVYLNAAVRAYPPIPEPVWIDVLWIGFFVWVAIGLPALRRMECPRAVPMEAGRGAPLPALRQQTGI